MSLLQGAEMVPPFLLMYATAVASIIQFQQHMQSGFIFAEAFKQKKAACNSRGNLFMLHLFSIQFYHLPPISTFTWTVLCLIISLPNLHQKKL